MSLIRLFRGEDREVPRSIVLTRIAPDTLSKAWLTVKLHEDDDDADAIFQKEITSVVGADGHITDTGSGDPLTATLYFLIPSIDTLAMAADIYYFYDIKGLSSTGAKKILEPEEGIEGRIIASHQITQAES